jgi:hypothetical protein
MRVINSFRAATLGLAMLAPVAAGFAIVSPAHAAIEDTIWRDEARIAAHTNQAPSQNQNMDVAKGRSTIATDASPALVGPARSNGPQLNGAGEPVNSSTGTELPGFNLGGF